MRRWTTLCAVVLLSSSCGADLSTSEREDTAPEIPEAWTGEASWYGDESCDCGCGAPDPDCTDSADVFLCEWNCCQAEQRPDAAEPPVCTPQYFSCNPAHVFADELPRRFPVEETGRPRSRPTEDEHHLDGPS